LYEILPNRFERFVGRQEAVIVVCGEELAVLLSVNAKAVSEDVLPGNASDILRQPFVEVA
jgi:hypothetical protein